MGTESGQAQLVEAASPISSRPPASAAVNLDELMPLQGGTADEDALAAAAGEGGAIGGGNRWPRQETLALLRIRSEMDAVFRDATLKGPLWEDVSRKLAELGYKRSAKKCKEKFENVHKYYKRTKEGRAGRQDGKSYKFFSELEALHSSAASSSATGNNASASFLVPPATTTIINPVISPVSTGIGIGSFISNAMPISSIRIPQAPPGVGMFPPDPSAAVIAPAAVSGSVTTPAAAAPPPTGISFSSNSSSSSPGSDDEEESLEGEPSNVGSSRKRKRGSSRAGSGSGTRRMMEFFENLMKQVMYKQEVMQQRFLEVIEKRDQDRMIREEAWKRQEMARLAREHELMAQDRAISASRDAAIVAFLQKITGQTVQLPTPTTVTNIPAAPPPTVPAAPTPPPPPPPSQQHHHYQQQVHQRSPQNAQVVMAIPEQQVPPQDTSGGKGLSKESFCLVSMERCLRYYAYKDIDYCLIHKYNKRRCREEGSEVRRTI
ncbi:trihelix transcription factor GTL1-like [Corylus avellana]|uniref:trihelix transcription factor GTL1-like n=1 Tax=Corylus avellana TaxID=13451 RepID=UPI00286AAE0E|nr:trihelix transcription factor GTL1-like [Corylus avellana]